MARLQCNLLADCVLHYSINLRLSVVDSREELKAFSKVHSEMECECEDKGIELLVVDLLWGNLQQQTQQQTYSKIVNHILSETSEALLVVSAELPTISSLKLLRLP